MQDQEPIILCHVACSGGSMIYRMILANFNLVGISEISHRFPFKKEAFIPTDPEYALLNGGEITDEEFQRVFFDRVLRSAEICKQKKKILLIREHSQSYFFFNSTESSIPEHPSWIAGQYLQRLNKRIKCIVTVRDPVDSWLGLLANFPGAVSADFQEYCSKYEWFVKSLRNNYDSDSILLIRYEDIIDNEVKQLHRIAKFLGIPFDGNTVDDWSQIASTGNSGRQGSSLQKRARRPFGTGLIREASLSKSYQFLIQELGYANLGDSVSTKVKIRAKYIDIRKSFANFLARRLIRFQDWATRNSRVP